MAKPIKAPPTTPFEFKRTTVKLTDVEVAQAAYNAGFRGENLAIATAIAFAESGANEHALNNRGEFSVGLWQINVNGYLVSRLKQFGLTSWIDLWNADNNAKAAYKISNGGKRWRAWSVYNSGRYLKLMPRATAAAKAVENPDPTTTPTTPNNNNTIRMPIFTPVQPSNVLPPVQTKVNDPLLPVIIIGVVLVIIVGIVLLTRKSGT